MKTRIVDWALQNRTTLILFGIIGGLILIALAFPKAQYPEVSTERLADDPSLGAADAVVTIIEYGDYACEGCALWHHSGVLDQILTRYDGQVRFVWRDNARISPASKQAAIAAQCAYDQGKFWEYHNLLFENPEGFSNEALKNYAQILGLNTADFDRCLDENRYYNKVLHNMKQAGEHGFSFTPAFTVNGEVIIGPPAESVLVEIIETILQEN